jgi:simple sugar transport system permease protein
MDGGNPSPWRRGRRGAAYIADKKSDGGEDAMSEALRAIFLTPWSSAFFAGNTLDTMALLLPAALGAALAFRAGLCNLGLEGQIYAGGFTAGLFLLTAAPRLHSAGCGAFALLAAAAVLAALSGAVLAALCALIKILTGANELITTFLLSASITPLIDYAIRGPLRDTSGNLLATPPLAADFLLPKLLPPSALSVSFLFALSLPAALYFFFNKTASGYRFRLMGNAPDFARYGGITPERYWLPAFSLSGALAGLSGFFAITGTYGVLHQGWTGGLGWAGITVALIAQSRSLAVIPAALFYAWLKTGTDTALLVSGAVFESSSLIQAVALFFVTARRERLFPRSAIRRTQ